MLSRTLSSWRRKREKERKCQRDSPSRVLVGERENVSTVSSPRGCFSLSLPLCSSRSCNTFYSPRFLSTVVPRDFESSRSRAASRRRLMLEVCRRFCFLGLLPMKHSAESESSRSRAPRATSHEPRRSRGAKDDEEHSSRERVRGSFAAPLPSTRLGLEVPPFVLHF